MGFEPGNIYSWHGITTSTHTHPLHTYVRVCELHLIGAVAALGSGGIANLYGKQQQGKSRKLLSPICILNYIHCWCSLALNPLSLAPLSLSLSLPPSLHLSPLALSCVRMRLRILCLHFDAFDWRWQCCQLAGPAANANAAAWQKANLIKYSVIITSVRGVEHFFFFCIFYIFFFLLANYRKYSFHFNFARQISERKMQLNIAAPRTLLTN